MAGEYVQVLGQSAWFSCGACPEELRGKKFTLKSSDGEDFAVDGESLCMARKTAKAALAARADAVIQLPFKKAVVSKLAEYFKYHRDIPPAEIRTPLVSDNLVECGALKWDASFVNTDRDLLFELLAAAVAMDIPSLIFLAGAKASLLIRGKTPDKLLKDFKLSNDLPGEEEEALGAVFTAHDESGLGGVAMLLNAIFQAAERNNILAPAKGEEPGPSAVSLKSFRHASWRAMVLSDWTQLGAAPSEVQADRDLVFAVLGPSCGLALHLASPELREDRRLVLEAVKHRGELLGEAAPALRGDREFVLEAIRVNGAALAGASDELRGDQGLLLEAAEMRRASALQGATSALRDDRAFVMECARRDPEAVRYASEELRQDRGFALELAASVGGALRHLPSKFRADPEVVGLAAARDPEALLSAHAAARAALQAKAPWDSEPALAEQRAEQDSAGVGAAAAAPSGKRIAALPPSKEAAEAEGLIFTRTKLQKIVQFSALSTMTANMGQSNYIAANSFLDKITFYERPEVDAVTLMWGAVGNIGMRWKAFASADFLNANPDALMQVHDAARVLNLTTTRMSVDEWYAASYFDDFTRQTMLMTTSGVHQYPGEGYQPPPHVPEAPRSQRGLEQGCVERPSAKAAESGPLGGWPSLGEWPVIPAGVAPGSGPEGGTASAATALPGLELAEGTRVVMSGLQSKNGTTGVLLKECSGGKWKVMMDGGKGNALLKACYLVPIAPPPAEKGSAEKAVAAQRHRELEERRARLWAKTAPGQVTSA